LTLDNGTCTRTSFTDEKSQRKDSKNLRLQPRMEIREKVKMEKKKKLGEGLLEQDTTYSKELAQREKRAIEFSKEV
jgi:hypothetical protein